MPIKNNQGLIPKIGSIRLGTPKPVKGPGRNSPAFRVESTSFSPDLLAAKLGPEPTELRIQFPKRYAGDNAASLLWVFDFNYKAYRNNSLWCKGDGETARRSEGKQRLQVSCPCDLLYQPIPQCKQRGELKVLLVTLPPLGYFYLATTSWHAINSINSVLNTYLRILGDRFFDCHFLLFKEEMVLKGNKQYILKLKIAPEHFYLVDSHPEQAALEEIENSFGWEAEETGQVGFWAADLDTENDAV